jgi:hypothetical protein
MNHDVLLKELEEQARLLGMSGEREAKLLAEKETILRELEGLRSRHGNFMRRIKAIMGYENWPELSDDFLDAVADLLEQRMKQLAGDAKNLQSDYQKAENEAEWNRNRF